MALRDLFETDEMRYAVRLSYKMIDGIMLSNIYADTNYFNNNTLTTDASGTIAYNSKDAGEYLNSLVTYRFAVVSDMRVQESLSKIAEHLLVLIKKEYHIK